ncbi:MAG: hypothetical protein KJ065_28255 [Anaerolineae bacterium]|nr:hypothetical protein [Anaerolineae bacterium]
MIGYHGLQVLVPHLRAGLEINTFTQALGSELLVNGDFDAWTGDNPDSWTVEGEAGSDPMITQVDSGGGVGTGSARLYSSSALVYCYQAVLTLGDHYEINTVLSAVTVGQARVMDGNGTIRPLPTLALTAAGTYSYFGHASDTLAVVLLNGAGDVVCDSVSVKKLMLNPESAFGADGTFELHFSLPGSPVAGQAAEMMYRANGTLNCWRARVRRDLSNAAWDFILDSVSSGTVTNRLTVTGIGAAPNAIRVVAAGSNHTCYTSTDGGASWTQRGSTVNNSTHSANTGLRAVYSSAVTPHLLRGV